MKSKIQFLLAFAMMFVMLGAFEALAQVPQLFNYQGIARDAKGNPLSNQKMSLKLSVLPTADATVAEYEETQLVNTNEFGLYTLQIGNGTAVNGNMKTVKWETGNKYIKVAIDPTGGNNYVDAGTNQLLSVPYAIYADKAGTAADGGHDKTRTGAVNSNAAHVVGDVNYLTKFTALNTIGKSLLFDNGTSVGLGTSTPSALARFHLFNSVGNAEFIRMQNTASTGFGKFIMYNDNASNYATFTKYGSAYVGGYPSIASQFPYANMLAFGNNLGPFLLANNGDVGIGIVTGGTTKLYFNARQSTGYLGIGGSFIPSANVHINNSATGDTLRITNATSGHLVTDGLEIRTTGNSATIMNRENSTLSLGTNNTTAINLTGAGNTEVNGQIKIAGGAPGLGKLLLSDATGLATWSTPAGAGLVSGSGTTNTIPKFTPDGTTLGNSNITDNGVEVSMGQSPNFGSTLNLGGPIGSDTASVSFSYAGAQYGTLFMNGFGQLQYTPNTSSPVALSPTFTIDDDGGGASFAEGVFIQGNTGIGITPSNKLHVKSASTNTNPILVENSATANPLFVVNEGAAGNGFVGVYDNAGTEGGRISGAADGRSWMMGKVGIGTTTPISKLQVVGEVTGQDTTIYATTTNASSNKLIAIFGNQPTLGFGAGVVGKGFGGTLPLTLPDVGVYGTSTNLGVWSAGTLRVSGSNEAVGRTLVCNTSSGNAIWSDAIGFSASGFNAAINTGVTVTIIYPTEDFDDGNGYNPATGEYTVPENGVYSFSYTHTYQGIAGATNHVNTKIKINGVATNAGFVNQVPNGVGFWNIQNTITRKLVAGDVVSVEFSNFSGVNLPINTTNGFSGFKVR